MHGAAPAVGALDPSARRTRRDAPAPWTVEASDGPPTTEDPGEHAESFDARRYVPYTVFVSPSGMSRRDEPASDPRLPTLPCAR